MAMDRSKAEEMAKRYVKGLCCQEHFAKDVAALVTLLERAHDMGEAGAHAPKAPEPEPGKAS